MSAKTGNQSFTRNILQILWISVIFTSTTPLWSAGYSGYLTRYDSVSGRADAAISDNRKFYQQSINIREQAWNILDEKGNVVAMLQPDYSEKRGSEYILRGNVTIVRPGHSIYSGMKISFQQSAETTASKVSRLPDRVEREEEKAVHEKILGTDRSTMVYIPSGKFILGSELLGSLHYTTMRGRTKTSLQRKTGLKSTHYAEVDAYYIDKYEVTWEQFAGFVRSTGYSFQLPDGLSNKKKYPVENVNYPTAEAYCKWAGKRLPSEMEWEKAARGSGLEAYITEREEIQYREVSIDYPVGNFFSAENCNTLESGQGVIAESNLKDASPYEVYGMCGNVPEWTSSWLLPYRGNTTTNSLYGYRYKVIRGGSYQLPGKFARAYERMPGGNPSLSRDYRAGFRCALSAN